MQDGWMQMARQKEERVGEKVRGWGGDMLVNERDMLGDGSFFWGGVSIYSIRPLPSDLTEWLIATMETFG